MHFFSWTWQEDNRAENTPETKGKGKEAERHLAAGEGQPPLPVRTTPQRGAAGQQVEARYGLLLCDLPVPEVVGGQPALGHGGPASERNHGEQVVQDPAGARLWEEGNTSSPSPGNIDPPPPPGVPAGLWWSGVRFSPADPEWESPSGGCVSVPPRPRSPPPRTSLSPGRGKSNTRPEPEETPGMGWRLSLREQSGRKRAWVGS